MSLTCAIYRCAKQDEMYLYVRDGLDLDELPEALRSRLGVLTPVMTLDLATRDELARADIDTVRARLADPGYYLQMPPNGQVQAQLYRGD